MELKELDIDSRTIARLLLTKARELSININTTKLQKLLYVLYGYALASENLVICTETPAAWPYGPVFARVQKVKLDEVLTSIDEESLAKSGVKPKLEVMIKEVLQSYGKYSAKVLSDWSHLEGSPWAKTMASSGGEYNHKIDNNIIYHYFKDNVLD